MTNIDDLKFMVKGKIDKEIHLYEVCTNQDTKDLLGARLNGMLDILHLINLYACREVEA